jgi:ABC-type cobalamin/Fe3+-siderophores transport system ATPase subunit
MRCACDNPFAVHRVTRERYRLTAAEWQALVTRLRQRDWRGEIVGPHGSGKTTLLEDLATKLEAQSWHVHLLRFNAHQPRLGHLASWDRDHIILVDGAEQLNIFDWRRLLRSSRRAGGLIVTTHRRRRLPLVHSCETSPELLSELAASLGERLPATACADLHARHRGNLRAALRELYDRWADGEDRSGAA